MGKVGLPVIDIFYSIQGEGKLAGVPSIFLRFAGCPVKCPWCDTAYAWNVADAVRMTVDEILPRVRACPTRHVVITGGEPLIHPKITDLTTKLRKAGYHVTIETAGVVYRRVACDLLSLSPKLPGTVPGRNVLRPAILRRLIAEVPDYQVKFVVGSLADVCDMMDVLDRNPFLNRDNVMLMPKSRNPSEYRKTAPKIARFALHEGLRFCPRLHLDVGVK